MIIKVTKGENIMNTSMNAVLDVLVNRPIDTEGMVEELLKRIKQEVPQELQEENGWLLWKGQTQPDGKIKKMPFMIDNTSIGWQNSNNTLEQVLTEFEKGKYTGVGIMPRFPFVAIDIDNCFEEDGHYSPLAKEVMDLMDSYSERSPSGKGLRIFVKTSRPIESMKKNEIGLELFATTGWVTVTGNVENYVDVKDCTEELESLIQKYWGKSDDKRSEGLHTSTIPIKEGQGRDNYLTSEAGRFIALNYPDEKVKSILTAINNDYCNPPLPEKDIDRIIRSMRRKDNLKRKNEEIKSVAQSNLIFDPQYCDWMESKKCYRPKNLKENLIRLLDHYGITSCYNELTKQLDIVIPNISYSQDNTEELCLQYIFNEALKMGFCGMTKDLISAILLDIGDSRKFHPVRTYLDDVYAKYKDVAANLAEYEKLENTLETPSLDPALKRKLLKKWLISCVRAVYSPKGISAHGVLVLQGEQGIGKTTWFRNLVSTRDWFKDGLTLDPNSKDSVAMAIKYWIAELGEIESTLKKDMDQLKSFITKDFDELRRPYAKKESKYPRRTIFCGSVNGVEFLKDDTGNRRFWILPVKSINYNNDVNMDLLWAEITHLALNGEAHWLDQSETAELSQNNKIFEARNYVDTILDSNFHWDKPDRFWMKSSDVFNELGQPNSVTATAIAKALKKRGVEDKTLDGNKYYSIARCRSQISVPEHKYKSAPPETKVVFK